MTAVPVPLTLAPPPAGLSDVYAQEWAHVVANMRVEFRAVTPEWAAQQLAERNTRNRRLSSAWLKLLSAIERGKMLVNGETIVFDTDGTLINGQHRLKAIAEGNHVVPMLIVYGVRPEAFATYDQGKRRNGADVLSIVGYEDCVTAAAALAWQNMYDMGDMRVGSYKPVPNDQIAGLADEYSDLLIFVKPVKAARCRLIPPGLLVFLYYQFSSRVPELADRWFEKVAAGVGVEKESHEFLLRRRLEDMQGRRDVGIQVEIAAMSVITWNRLVKSDPVPGYLVWKSTVKDGDRKFPAIEPAFPK